MHEEGLDLNRETQTRPRGDHRRWPWLLLRRMGLGWKHVVGWGLKPLNQLKESS